MSNLMTIARRFLATRAGEKGEKGEKPFNEPSFSPLSPFFHPYGSQEPAPPLVGADQGDQHAANHVHGHSFTSRLLVGAEPWDQRAALRLIVDADALVEQLGVDGQHPVIVSAAAMVTNAFATRDMETLRFAVAEFTVLVRGLAGIKGATCDTTGRS